MTGPKKESLSAYR